MAYIHTLVQGAIRRGELKRPLVCESCGLIRATWAHHDDYLKPLEVRWLCKPCHGRWHSLNGPGLNFEIAELPIPGSNRKAQKPRTTEEEYDSRCLQMQEMLASGLTLRQVGEEFGLTRERVRQIAGSPYEFRRPRGESLKALGDSKMEEIKALRLQGKSIREIGEELQIPMQAVATVSDLPVKPPRPLNHGRATTYNRGCRCDQCTAANRIRMQVYKRKVRTDGFSGLAHGRKSTYNLGCKCAACLKIGRESQHKLVRLDPSEAVRKAWETRRQRYGNSGCKNG